MGRKMVNYMPFFSPQEKSKWFMDKKSNEEKEARFSEIMQQPPYPVDEVLGLIAEATGAKKDEWILAALQAFAEADDFDAAFRLVREFESDLGAKPRGEAVKEGLKKATKDRLVTSFIESVGFGVRPFKDSVARLVRLLSFQPGVFVLNSAWGLGEIKRLDAFYRRITVDFRTRRGHQLTFDAACETLVLAPEGHILVTAKADPDRVQKMLKDEPGEFVKAMLGSFGNMPVTRLEELSAQHGFVKSANWKSFWERARADLRKDRLVEIPTRRAEPLVLKAAAESYGDGWFTAFEQMTDPKSILTAVREFVGAGKFKGLDDAGRKKISDRLAFALKGARKVDDALYARLAACLAELKLDDAVASKARAYLWGESRYLAAARDLPASEVARFVSFLVAENEEEAKKNLFAALPQMCFPLLAATLEHYRTDEACETAVADLLKTPHAPATLVVLVLGRYHEVKKAKSGASGDKVEVETETGFKNWSKLPPLVVILTHAIALGEGRQSGETLKMQNTIRRLFADQKWLADIFGLLEPADKVLFFERFQASTTWDPSTHHTIVVRMTHSSRLSRCARSRRPRPRPWRASRRSAATPSARRPTSGSSTWRCRRTPSASSSPAATATSAKTRNTSTRKTSSAPSCRSRISCRLRSKPSSPPISRTSRRTRCVPAQRSPSRPPAAPRRCTRCSASGTTTSSAASSRTRRVSRRTCSARNRATRSTCRTPRATCPWRPSSPSRRSPMKCVRGCRCRRA